MRLSLFLLNLDMEVDCGSVTSVHGKEGTLYNPPMPEARTRSAPISSGERSEGKTPLMQHNTSDARCPPSATRSMSNNSWSFSKRRVPYAVYRTPLKLNVIIVMCSHHPLWKDVSVKRLSILSRRGPSTQRVLRPIILTFYRHYAWGVGTLYDHT